MQEANASTTTSISDERHANNLRRIKEYAALDRDLDNALSMIRACAILVVERAGTPDAFHALARLRDALDEYDAVSARVIE